MSKTVAIAGMGWLGLSLAVKLQTLGYKVKGSVTSEEKARGMRSRGFHTLVMEISENGVSGDTQSLLADTDYLIILIPPGLRKFTGSDYVLKMSHFMIEIQKSSVKKVLFVSSTSVYGDEQGKVTERNRPKPETEAGKQLHQVEQLFFEATGFEATIVRFGGLYGGSRIPVRYLAGRKDLSNGDAPVNLIHREDCIGIIIEIIKQDAFGHIFNAVMPGHPLKREYYRKQAEEYNLVPPSYSESSEEAVYKQVDSLNLKEVLDYSFKKQL